MISLSVICILISLMFGVIGYMRGWQREVIAMAGLIASIALLQWFGVALVNIAGALTGMPAGCGTDPLVQCRQEFWIQAVTHATIAFFSYQVVSRLAEQVVSGRTGDRIRTNLEKQIIGAGIGFLNGFLLVGSFWGFLEYQLILPRGYQQLEKGLLGAEQCLRGYVFDAGVIARPVAACDPVVWSLADWLPMAFFSPTLWLLAFFLIFFIVIIALI